MSKSKKNSLVKSTLVSDNVSDLITMETVKLNRDDMVALAVHSFEKRLAAKYEEITKSCKEMSEQVSKVVNDMNNYLRKMAEEYWKEELNDVLMLLGLDSSDCEYTYKMLQNNNSVAYQVSFAKEVNTNHVAGFGQLNSVAQELDKVYLDYMAAKTDLEKKIQEGTNLLMDIKKKLYNIPSMERAVKAQLAAAKLETTDEGRELLDRLTNMSTNEILALPAR